MTVRADQILRRPCVRRISKGFSADLCARETDVIDPFKQNNVRDARHFEDVPIEARQGANPEAADVNHEAVAQEPVTGDALIDHRELRTFRRLSQTRDGQW